MSGLTGRRRTIMYRRRLSQWSLIAGGCLFNPRLLWGGRFTASPPLHFSIPGVRSPQFCFATLCIWTSSFRRSHKYWEGLCFGSSLWFFLLLETFLIKKVFFPLGVKYIPKGGDNQNGNQFAISAVWLISHSFRYF